MIIDDFQVLVDNNKASFTDEVYGLFTDSFRCFRAGIYRPAYLLAYQAMMQHFRFIIMNGNKPKDYDDGKWKGLIKKLRNDKEFDEEVFKCVQRKNAPKATPPEIAILDMPNEIRQDFEFWRRRRNDCAHYKSYDINASQPIALYSFLNQYLLRISMEGGKNTLLHEFADACDAKRNSPNKLLQPLVDKILLMVSFDEMNDFFSELGDVMDSWIDSRYNRLLNSILDGENMQLKQYLIQYLKKDTNIIGFLEDYPEKVGVLLDAKDIRRFWSTIFVRNRCRAKILAYMLMEGLIDKSEINDAIASIVTACFKNNEGFYKLSNSEWEILERYGILNVLSNLYFNVEYTSNHAMDCGRSHYNFFDGVIEFIPLDEKWLNIIIGIFTASNYPKVWLANYTRNYLMKDDYRKQFEDKCCEYNITIPAILKV